MKFRTAALLGPMAAAIVMLGGCASGVRLDDPAPVENRAVDPGQGGTAGATPQSQVATVDLSAGQQGQQALSQQQRVVYFDYDSFIVREDSKPAVTANAKHLTADPTRRVTIEGHTDERGGREYNLALGQKRAESVRRSLELLGVRENQMEAVSYGEERPAVQGQSEEAWARNRRAELNYR
ncbi:peptidoglycan-associated lipoprotein Pal [Caldimonas tepidiphila]|uniref:peptidoglycan-associated lipoprotein Pal n=1 Tax=Caldimonas tepidiphila TaxID=2315841 RepID=UPI00196B961C|nr:peptidoglycan-associated lipoprotein Pal [Caldimonas tepidiphila]